MPQIGIITNNTEVEMSSYTLSKLKRKKKSELLSICSSNGVKVEGSDSNAIIAMKILAKLEKVEAKPESVIPKETAKSVAKTLGVGLDEIKQAVKEQMRKPKLTVFPTKDDSAKFASKQEKQKVKEEKKQQVEKVKKERSKKAKAKKQAAMMFIKMVVMAMLEDAKKSKNGIKEEEGVWLIPAALFGPTKLYKIVKTYSTSRQAWMGNGRRCKETGTWLGHRHPAPRMLLELGYESFLKKQNGEWVLHVQPKDEFVKSYTS